MGGGYYSVFDMSNFRAFDYVLKRSPCQPVISCVSQLHKNVTLWRLSRCYAIDMMPAENYSFRTTPLVRNFGELVAHVADVQIANCSVAKGESKSGNAKGKTSKADLVAALNISFEYCDLVYGSMTDESGAQVVKLSVTIEANLGRCFSIILTTTKHTGPWWRICGLKVWPPWPALEIHHHAYRSFAELSLDFLLSGTPTVPCLIRQHDPRQRTNSDNGNVKLAMGGFVCLLELVGLFLPRPDEIS